MANIWVKVSCKRLQKARDREVRRRAWSLYVMLCTGDKVRKKIKNDKKKKDDDRRKDDDKKKDDDQEHGGGGKSVGEQVLIGALKTLYEQGWQF